MSILNNIVTELDIALRTLSDKKSGTDREYPPIPKEKNTFTSEQIFNVCKKLNLICYKKTNIKLANQFLKKTIKPKLILVTGSLYLIGNIRDKNYK